MSRKKNQTRSKKKGGNAKSRPAVASQPPRKRKAGAKQQARTPAAHYPHIRNTCDITNALCPGAKGTARPDGMGMGTICFPVRGSLTVTTDASGGFLTIVSPGLGRYGYVNCTQAAGTWTLGTNWSVLSGSAWVNNNAGEVRIVSMAFTFRSTASATNCQGLVHSFVLTTPTLSSTITVLNQNNVEDKCTPLTAGYETSWLSKPLGASAHTFRPYADASATMSNFDWTSGGLEILGGPVSTTVGYIEVIVNVEVQLSAAAVTTSGIQGAVTVRKPANPVALAAQQHTQSTIPSLLKGGVEEVERTVAGYATSAVSYLLSGVEDMGLALLGF